MIPHLIWYLLQVVIYDITIILFEFSIGNIIGIIIGTCKYFESNICSLSVFLIDPARGSSLKEDDNFDFLPKIKEMESLRVFLNKSQLFNKIKCIKLIGEHEVI